MTDQGLQDEYEIQKSRQGSPTVKLTHQNRTIWLHSRFDPVKEAEKAVSSLESSLETVIIGGLGLGYHVEAALHRVRNARFYILEPDPQMKILCLKERPSLKKIFESENIKIFHDQELLIQELDKNSSGGISFFFHRPSFDLYPDVFGPFKNSLTAFIQKKKVNMATLGRFEKLWARNIEQNIPGFIRDPGVSGFFGKLKDIPVVLAGAGPSLDEDLHLLKKYRKKFILAAVDSAVYPLVGHGLNPDIIFSVDPQIINSYFFYRFHKKNTGSVLVYEPSANSLVLRLFQGPRFTMDSIFPLISWFTGHLGSKGVLDMGGSVSTTAFDFVLKSGAGPVILAGQDMAFSYNKTHCRGSLVEYFLLRRSSRFCPLETLAARLSGDSGVDRVKSNSGKIVHTDRRLLLVYWWFQKKMKTLKNREVWTIARDGACIEGIKFIRNKELEDYFKNSPNHEFKVPGYDFNLPDKRFLIRELEIALNSMKELQKLTVQAHNISKKLYIHVQKKMGPQVRELVQKLNILDKDIEGKKEANLFIGMTMQKALFSILEGYEDFLTEEEKKDPELTIVRRSILIYQEMEKSIFYNYGLLERVRSRLDCSDNADVI